MRGRILALTVLVLAGTGCTGSAGTSPPQGVTAPPAPPARRRAPVPWIDRPVLVDNAIAVYAQLGSPAASPCTPGQLVAARPVSMEGVTGDETAGAVALRNVGRAACTVSGDPRLDLSTAAGQPLPLTERAWPETLGRMAHWWGYPRVSIRPGQYAWAQLTGVLGCDLPPRRRTSSFLVARYRCRWTAGSACGVRATTRSIR
jgi:hypothetical protein